MKNFLEILEDSKFEHTIVIFKDKQDFKNVIDWCSQNIDNMLDIRIRDNEAIFISNKIMENNVCKFDIYPRYMFTHSLEFQDMGRGLRASRIYYDKSIDFEIIAQYVIPKLTPDTINVGHDYIGVFSKDSDNYVLEELIC